VIHVVSKYKHKPTDNDFYIGRGSPLGNPYTSIKDRKTKAEYVCDSRDESIERYEIYINEQIKNKNKDICSVLNNIYLKALTGDVYLVCFCHPKSCHGDIIKKIVEEKITYRNREKILKKIIKEDEEQGLYNDRY
jgi:hypothetical protein